MREKQPIEEQSPVGVFDSGVGGISVLRELVALYPREVFIYYGDSRSAPYGEKTQEEIARLTRKAVDFLLSQGIKALVIACNAATSAVVSELRAEISIPVVGMEPALKPAHDMRKGGQIIVLATQATLRQEKFRALMLRYGQDAVPVPVYGLVERLEKGEMSGEAVERVIRDTLAPHLTMPTDVIVLGCTHYIFVKELISRIAGGIPVIDGNHGTAMQLGRLLAESGLSNARGPGGVKFYTTGDPQTVLPIMEKLLHTK